MRSELLIQRCRPMLSAVLCAVASLALPPAQAASRNPARSEITRTSMELLKTECFACHNRDKRKGDLDFTTRDSLLKGNSDGPVALPGKPESSRLLDALASDSDPHMPPKKQLADSQIKTLRDWIKNGAPWDAKALEDDEPKIKPVQLDPPPPSYQPALALALSPDSKRLAVARAASIVLHDLAQTNFPVLAQWTAHPDPVQSLAWSPDGHRLISGAFRRIALWNAETFTLEHEHTHGLAGIVTAIEFAPDGNSVSLADSVAGQAGYLRAFDPATRTITASWRAHGDTLFDLAFSRDGARLASAGGDGLIKVWDPASHLELARLEGHAFQALTVAFNHDASQIVSGGADKEIKVWDLNSLEKIISLGNRSARVTAVAWPGDAKTVFASTGAGLVLSFTNLKAHSGEQSSNGGDEKRIGGLDTPALSLDTSADATVIVAGSHDGAIHIWNKDRKLLAKLSAPASTRVDPATNTLNRGSNRTRNLSAPKRLAPPPPKPTLKSSEIVSLSASPSEIRLTPGAPTHGLLLSAHTSDGFEIDVTALAKYSAPRGSPFEVHRDGILRASLTGEGAVTATVSRHRIEIPVRVESQPASEPTATPDFSPPPVSFIRDLLPALSRAGCNSGSCHAKGDGQNGFKLSVFSYDPKSDYEHIVMDARGRRVFPSAPEQSLLLLKPTTTLPHEGGLRFTPGSETYQLLVRWMREGMNYSITNEPALEELAVFPNARRYRKNSTQRLLVQARYSDGSLRDVTRLSAFSSNDKEIATVDEHGVATVGSLPGQGVVVARYMGLVADAHILVPADQLLPESHYAALPRNNFIDDLAYAQFQRLGLLPSDLCTDAEFLRRASLDAIGVLPTPDEARSFLAIDATSSPPDPLPGGESVESHPPLRAPNSPGASSSESPPPAFDDLSKNTLSKRRALIDELLARPEYADYWASKWADLLRPNPDRVGVKSVFVLDQWLRETFRQNIPYDRFVRDILLAEGTNHEFGPAVIYRDRRDPPELTTMFSQLFLGTRLECARCHHHPNEKWSQDDFYQFAAFFGSVKQKGAGLSPPISAGTESFFFKPGGSVKHPVNGNTMSPRPPGAAELPLPQDADPRRTLADWLIAPDNPFFARAAVNRVWAVFFGRGLVEPVDDFRISNPCVNQPLLDALAMDFATHNYDLKHLIRTIMESRLYQLSSTPNETNLRDTRNFSRAYRRRLPAEVLLDAVNDATRVPDSFAATPIGSRATQVWSYKIESQFMDAFNRPNPSSDPPCERDTDLSVVQSLHLMNSKAIQSKLDDTSGRARQLAGSDLSPAQIVAELYLATLTRPPNAEELQVATNAFSAPDATRQAATEDVLWALLNSAEFVLNH